MSYGVHLKIKSNGGDVCSMTVAELIEIDGRAYVPAFELADHTEVLNLIANRLDNIEAAVCGEPAPTEEA